MIYMENKIQKQYYFDNITKFGEHFDIVIKKCV